MDHYDVDRRLRLIEDLELPPVGERLTLPILKISEDNKKAGYVNSGSLTSFVAGLPSQNKEDVLNSTLLAQLAANKKYDREKYPEDWYKFFANTLNLLAWVVQEFKFDKYQGALDKFTVDTVTLALLQAIATKDELEVINQTMQALKALEDGDNRVVLFNKDSHSLKQGNFQMGTASLSESVVVMRFAIFYFSTEDTVKRLLWMQFKQSNTSFYLGRQTLNLNISLYEKIRKTVIEKLGDEIKSRIAEIEI